MQSISSQPNLIIAAALGKFALQEYGKLRQRELDRIDQELVANGMSIEATKLKSACYSRASESWKPLIGDLDAASLQICASGAKAIARGSGRAPVSIEMAKRIGVLFEGNHSAVDIDFSYQDYLQEKQEAELQDILLNGPLWSRVPRWRITSVEGQVFDCSSIPGNSGRIRITLFRFDTRAEFTIRAKDISRAIDLSTGEELTVEKFLRVF